MKNRVLLVFLAMVLVASLATFGACAKEEEGPPVEEEGPPVEEEGPPVEEVWQWPDKLIILAHQAGSSSYARDMGYGIVLEDDTGMKVRVVGEDNFILRYTWMKQGRFFWTTFESMHMITMLEAVREFASRDGGPWQMRIAYSSARPTFMGFAVRADSGIKTPHDIKPGMKIGYLTIGPVGRIIMGALLAWAQIDPEDVVWVGASTPSMGAVHLMDGRADIEVGAPGSPCWFEAEASPHGLAWMELNAEEDPEGARRLLEIIPHVMIGLNTDPAAVPSAAGVGMLADIGIKVTGIGVDPELVYHMVKWVDENYDRFKDAHPSLPGMSFELLMRVIESSFVPVHEATIRYLKEKGVWTDAHEARQQANIELMTKWCEAYQTAMDMADEQGISVDPRNEEWIELWENYKKELGLPKFKVFPGLD